jgi:hypothetical protein
MQNRRFASIFWCCSSGALLLPQYHSREHEARPPRRRRRAVAFCLHRRQRLGKQRLAIARALLNDPQYLIFDEATSALDCLNDHLIGDAFTSCLVGRTAIFIAHWLSTIRNSHRTEKLCKTVPSMNYQQNRIIPRYVRRKSILNRLIPPRAKAFENLSD